MAKQKIETSIEINGVDVVAYPLVESDHVTFENGMSINEMIKGDVSTPVVTHEEISFKVGKGDSDVSSSIVDSSVGEMTIKGQTYQNILPDPSLQNNMNNGKSMQKINEGYDSVNVVDGIAKSAILSGNTLVNLMTNCKDEYVVRYYAANNPDNNVANISMMKPNTEYTLFYKAKYRTEGDGAGTSGVLKIATSIEQGFISTAQSLTTEYKQYVYRFTTSSVVDCFVFSTTDKYFAIKECVLLEGNYTQDYIPYFEGMTSCKMPVLCTTGKNLFDSSTEIVTGQGINSTNGLPYNASSHSYTGFLRVKSNTTYTITQSHNRTWVFAYNKNKEYIKVVKTNILSGGNFTTPNDTYYIRLDFNTANTSEIVNGVQIEEGSVATSYEPYKTNILHTPEDVVLREVNGVRDTLNLMTGEYVQRIGEVVLDGTSVLALNKWEFGSDCTEFNFNAKGIKGDGVTLSNFAKSYLKSNRPRNIETVSSNNLDNTFVLITIQKSKLVTDSVEGMNQYLQSNPITIQYELKTPIVKTVDLSSSGNWEKVVLDGSEDESWGDGDNGLSKTHRFYVRIPNSLSGNHRPITDSTYFTAIEAGTSFQDTPCVQVASNNIYFRIERQIANDLTSFKTWLQSNPLTVWYPTATHQDSTQVKQPIFFKDGHIQLSSGADNSLIPTLDYQAKTSNSYVMDLMKTNTRYTMKAKSASGTFTIDGTSYGAGTNGTFTTPSSMTNKLLVMSNKTNEEVMIIEGDVVSKTIPYFKGIKSAFEGEDEIEILSTGRNIFDSSTLGTPTDEGYFNRNEIRDRDITLKPNTTYTLSYESKNTNFTNPQVWTVRIYKKGGVIVFGEIVLSSETHSSLTFTTDNKGDLGNLVLSFVPNNGDYTGEYLIKNIQLKECAKQTPYEPYKSNITKIPLSSPLRSLPNGVRDEVILDRENNKVKVIQRVGEQVFDGSSDENWTINQYNPYKDGTHYQVRCWLGSNAIKDGLWLNKQCILSDRLPSTDWELHWNGIGNHGIGGDRENIMITWKRDNALFSDVATLRAWLSKNPTTVYYELATPVITEIDLDGYPYIYKDGHIFLNSKIAPTTTMKYSINQSHQIASQNGDLIRHEKEINYLYTLIAKYVNVQYESTLLNLDLELSRA